MILTQRPEGPEKKGGWGGVDRIARIWGRRPTCPTRPNCPTRPVPPALSPAVCMIIGELVLDRIYRIVQDLGGGVPPATRVGLAM